MTDVDCCAECGIRLGPDADSPDFCCFEHQQRWFQRGHDMTARPVRPEWRSDSSCTCGTQGWGEHQSGRNEWNSPPELAYRLIGDQHRSVASTRADDRERHWWRRLLDAARREEP